MIALIIAGLVAQAAPVGKPSAAIVGVGTLTCGTWTQRRKNNEPDRYVLSAWLAGYVTAVDVMVTGAGKPTILDGLDVNALTGWIDNDCAAHPLDRLSDAAERLTLELFGRKR